MFTVIDVRKQLGLSVGGVSDRQLSIGWWYGERGCEAIALEAGCHCLVKVLIIPLGWSSVPHLGHSGAKVGCEKASVGDSRGQGEEADTVSPLFRTEGGFG